MMQPQSVSTSKPKTSEGHSGNLASRNPENMYQEWQKGEVDPLSPIRLPVQARRASESEFPSSQEVVPSFNGMQARRASESECSTMSELPSLQEGQANRIAARCQNSHHYKKA